MASDEAQPDSSIERQSKAGDRSQRDSLQISFRCLYCPVALRCLAQQAVNLDNNK